MRKLSSEELNRLNVNQYKEAVKSPVIIILDNIRSLYNIGSIFRTADAFRIEKIVLCGISGTPPHREINKTALGSTESVNWEYYNTVVDAIKIIKELNYKIVAIEQTNVSINLNDFNTYDSKLAYIFGNEINGVSDEALLLCDYFVDIPQFGIKHSFNVAVSVGIVLWNDFINRSKIK
ncbi:MAG TPA: RNA methyltransferase [Bacteroidales bacterium]|nr:RNA methyltransferase [Bacteroidales bacterium]